MAVWRASSWIAVGACLFALSGCGPIGADRARLLVATSRPRAERARIAAEFAHWLDAEGVRGKDRPRLEWLPIRAGDDRARLVARRNPPEVLLGCPAAALVALQRDGALSPLPFANAPAWATLRAAPPTTDAAPRATIGGLRGLRGDPIALAHARNVLQEEGFRAGLARLVEEAATQSLGAAANGPGRALVPSLEGVAIVRKAPQAGLARTFARFLESSGRIAGGPVAPERETGLMADALLVNLLEAVLVDARDELWSAWAAFEKAGRPEGVHQLLTGPPPWPPASIVQMLGRDDMAMVEALASQIAPGPNARNWLIRSWLAPGRAVDRGLLDEIARADHHELCRGPRFRDWLRAEWTAWARQRYRAARQAANGRPAAPPA